MGSDEKDGMALSDFRIGAEFESSGRVFRCTDIGTRTVVAIRVDSVTLSCSDGSRRGLTREEAEREGWFEGPPYAVAETVFDEEDLVVCSPLPDQPARR